LQLKLLTNTPTTLAESMTGFYCLNSNARYNGYLKELAVIAGINRNLNTHLARHALADMMLNIFEFSLEEVSKMLGHKSIRTTQRYTHQ
jgi:site-specific recombinase XerD